MRHLISSDDGTVAPAPDTEQPAVGKAAHSGSRGKAGWRLDPCPSSSGASPIHAGQPACSRLRVFFDVRFRPRSARHPSEASPTEGAPECRYSAIRRESRRRLRPSPALARAFHWIHMRTELLDPDRLLRSHLPAFPTAGKWGFQHMDGDLLRRTGRPVNAPSRASSNRPSHLSDD